MKHLKLFKLYEYNSNIKYKSILTNSEMFDFIEDNDLRDVGGKIDYNGAKDIVYKSDTGIWKLKELSLNELDKKGLDFLYDKKPKSLGIPIIIIHYKKNDSYEILDGKHRVGYTRYKNLPNILAYITEIEHDLY